MNICEECISRKADDIAFLREQSFAYRKMGHIWKLLGDHSKALHEHTKALEKASTIADITKESQDYLQLSGCYINLGEFCEEQYNFSDAERAYLNALTALLSAKNTETVSGRHQQTAA